MSALAAAPEIFVNPARVRAARSDARSSQPIAFHRRLPAYAPTPLVAAPELASALGLASLHLKDESSRLGLPSFKILGASWAVYRLVIERLGREPEWHDLGDLRSALAPLGRLTLVTATDGNHGRAVARMARLLGFDARIFVPRGTAVARVNSIESEGAVVTVVDGTYDDAVKASAALAADDMLVVSDTSWAGYTDVPRRVIEGYSTIFSEVDDQIGEPPDVLVVQTGVGALAAAAIEHSAADDTTIVVVEPLTAACAMRAAEAGHPVLVPGPHDSIMAGLNCGTVSIVAWPLLRRGVDVFVAVGDGEAEQAMRDLAGIGIVAGETGGAGLAGLRALIEDRAAGFDLSGRRALALCTEGATDPDAYQRIVGRSVAK